MHLLIELKDLYTYIDDQLDDIDKEQLIQNTSINKIISDVSIKYEYLLALINKSSGEMGDVITDGIAGLRKEFKDEILFSFKICSTLITGGEVRIPFLKNSISKSLAKIQLFF